MGIEEWEIEYDRSCALRLFRDACYKHFEQTKLVEFLEKEHSHTLSRLALEIEIGEIDDSYLGNEDGFSKAKKYLLRVLATPSQDEAFYGLIRGPLIKAAVIDYFADKENTFEYNLYPELPLSLRLEGEVIRAAIRGHQSNLYRIEGYLIHAHGGPVLQEVPELFLNYLHRDDTDPAFIASLFIENINMYSVIAKAQRKDSLPEHWKNVMQETNAELMKLGVPTIEYRKPSLLTRLNKKLIESYEP